MGRIEYLQRNVAQAEEELEAAAQTVNRLRADLTRVIAEEQARMPKIGDFYMDTVGGVYLVSRTRWSNGGELSYWLVNSPAGYPQFADRTFWERERNTILSLVNLATDESFGAMLRKVNEWKENCDGQG